MSANLTKPSESLSSANYFYFFILIHLVAWTTIPALVRYNLPLDAIEGTIWGQHLEWGYDKNPFLNGWLTALATFLDGQSGWMIYLFSQISVVTCFYAIWRLAKLILSPLLALISVMLLEGIQYYNFHAIDFNDNTLELGLWALTIYCFYLALNPATPAVKRGNRVRTAGIAALNQSITSRFSWAWLGVGFFAGLGMMAKYYTAALLFPMFLFLLLIPENRQRLKTLPPYLGLLVFLIIVLPHIIWLLSHDFITVRYVFERTSTPASWTNHIFFPTQFAYQQLQAFLPTGILFSLLFIGKKPLTNTLKISSFDKSFLFFIGIGPFLFTVLLSFLFGIKLRAGWGMPLLSLTPVILFAFVSPRLSKIKIYSLLTFIYIFIFSLLTGYSFSLIRSTTTTSANFPGREIAQLVTKLWHDRYHTPLSYVAGSRWIGGNIAFYSPDHPSVFIEWDKSRSPWINMQELEQNGAIFVWDITGHEKLSSAVQMLFPQLINRSELSFDWKRNYANLPPIKIGIAILPPKNILTGE